MSTPTGSHHQHRFCSPTNHRARLIRHNIREGTCKNVLCTEDVRCEPKWRPCRKSAWHFTVQLRLQTRNCTVTCLGWTDLSLSSNTIPGNCGPQQRQYGCFEAESTMSSHSSCRWEQPHIVICLTTPLTYFRCSGEIRRITREPLIRVQQPTSTNKQRSSCIYWILVNSPR
jgi:hypothetical protein